MATYGRPSGGPRMIHVRKESKKFDILANNADPNYSWRFSWSLDGDWPLHVINITLTVKRSHTRIYYAPYLGKGNYFGDHFIGICQLYFFLERDRL